MHSIRPVFWNGDSLQLLDQRLLPEKEEYLACKSVNDVTQAIRQMVVRGAPAIGVSAAFGMVLAAKTAVDRLLKENKEDHASKSSFSEMYTDLKEASALLKNSRPTAVNLFWAVEKILQKAVKLENETLQNIVDGLEQEAEAMLREDIVTNKRIGDFGAELLPKKGTVLTHCNAGALATGGYGTALGVIRSAVARGKSIHVLVDETRPLFQGSRLTAWELRKDNIPVTIIVDSAAGHFLQGGYIQCVVVGADRVAANGDVANKIGTYALAVLCKENNIPFYVAAPISTFDFAMQTGSGIEVEERAAEEITSWKQTPIAPVGVAARNPAFDITPAYLVSALITERGLIFSPDADKLGNLPREGKMAD